MRGGFQASKGLCRGGPLKPPTWTEAESIQTNPGISMEDTWFMGTWTRDV